MKITNYGLVSFGIMILMAATVIATKSIMSSFLLGTVVSLLVDWKSLKSEIK